MLKQRKDAWQQFTDASREDLAAVEAYEISVIEGFLPAQMEGDELEEFVSGLLSEIRCPRHERHGQSHGVAKSEGQGRVDMGKASALVKAQLGNL